MENDKDLKQQKPSRMKYDIEDTSRTMKPGSTKDINTTSPSISGSSTTTTGSKSRGWHGDTEGHAKAGSQSHKKSGDKKS